MDQRVISFSPRGDTALDPALSVVDVGCQAFVENSGIPVFVARGGRVLQWGDGRLLLFLKLYLLLAVPPVGGRQLVQAPFLASGQRFDHRSPMRMANHPDLSRSELAASTITEPGSSADSRSK